MCKITIEELTKFCRMYGFIYPGSEIYGGLANTWDYGPLGTMIKNNVKNAWRKRYIQQLDNSFEIDSSILMHPRIWEASGHVDSFCDPKIECKECRSRFRADKFIENQIGNEFNVDVASYQEMDKFIKERNMKCPICGSQNFTKIRRFSQMFETYRGSTDDNKSILYLRPENAQGEYMNYLNVLKTTRSKLPFGIGQIGKAFRNEITPGNFIFRTIEFEQMEYQNFCRPGTDENFYEFYKLYARKFFIDIGLSEKNLRFHNHEKLAFYAKAACDIEFKFPFGFDEINGTHNRTDYDLSQHQKYSNKNISYKDNSINQEYIPYIVESTIGVDRCILAILCEAYNKEKMENGKFREVMKFHPYIAPYKIAIFPLISKKHSNYAKKVYKKLANKFFSYYDESGSIGKRYRRSDIYGIPFSITIDDKTLNENIVTIRNRDTMKQEYINISDLEKYIIDKIYFD